jgi:dipeptidyl-peptidase-3
MEEAGKYNFDIKNPPVSPITSKPVTTWYKPGETWGSIFKSVASSYEECRAECVAMYLGVDKEILSIFKHEHQEAEDVIYVGFLTMARAGLCALEFYEPKTKKWGQAHMQARYAILQVFVKSGLVTLDRSQPDNVIVQLNRNDILTKGVPAVGDFLMRLNVYKATADAHNGIQFYVDSTTVDDSWLPIRDIVIAKKLPRKMFVQASTVVDQDKVRLIEYEPTLKGLIQSYVERNVW